METKNKSKEKRGKEKAKKNREWENKMIRKC